MLLEQILPDLIISSSPYWISKIFVQGFYNSLTSLDDKIGTGSLFFDSTF